MQSLLLLLLAPTCIAQLPWLTVREVDLAAHPNATRRFLIADEFGRELTLRGACVESEERSFPPYQRSVNPADYDGGACPSNVNGFSEPPICGTDAGKGKWAADASDLGRNDFAQARALGFNIVRLCLSWSALEPTPGVYSAMYLDRVAQMVAWAAEQEVYVILDLHEDLYSLWIYAPPNQTGVPGLLTPGAGQDGAPAWAVDTGGWPSLNVLGVSIFNLAVMASFDAFYDNKVLPGVPQGAAPGPGLQDHYIGALAALAARFVDEPAVAGFELMNEPLPGTRLPPLAFGRDFLYPFYKRAVQAVTGVSDGLPRCAPPAYGNCSYPDLGVRDARHLIFAEPSALRNEVDFSAEEIPGPWTSYPHIVHTPHVVSFARKRRWNGRTPPPPL
jgi:endoglycosylceramidase